MTWKQFKDHVERLGVKDDDEIAYINTYPDKDTQIKDTENGKAIWS
jgi:hypothetical protein